MNSTKHFPLHVVYFCLHLDLLLGSCKWGVPVGALYTHNLVLSTGAASAVVWLRWDVENFGVSLSRSLELRYPVV